MADELPSLEGQRGEPDGGAPPAFVVSGQAAAHIHDDFFEALEKSSPPYELGQGTFFADEDEKHIRDEVQRKLYDPLLANGGDKERKVVDKLKKLAADHDWKYSGEARAMIADWEAVLPRDPKNAGAYYLCRPMARSDDKEEFDFLKSMVRHFHDTKEWDRKWFMELLLEGPPEAVSDFEIECLFLLRKSDGKVDRLVRLRNILGEVSKGPHQKGSVIMDSKAFASPEKFREFCLGFGNFAWFGNQIAVQKLHRDYTHSNAWRVINQVDSCGWLPVAKKRSMDAKSNPGAVKILSGIWFCDECAYADGKVLMAEEKGDDEGIYWYEGEGYYLNQKGRESTFKQGRPKLNPMVKIADALRTPKGFIGQPATDKPTDKAPDDVTLYRGFYREVCAKFYDTVGSHEGWMLLGAMFSFAAAPELFHRHGEFPGAWLHGQASSGKSKIAAWLMRIWGFDLDKGGIGLGRASTAGLMQELENYSSLPLLADEYRNGVHEAVESVLRDAFNRISPVKWSPDGVQRVVRTSFLVSGESTSSDAALRSRYLLVQLSASKRLHDHLLWMEEHKNKFYLFGRLLLERRAEFVKLVVEALADWMQEAPLPGVNNRDKYVHGVMYASWLAMTRMLGSHTEREIAGLTTAVIDHAIASAADVISETNVNVFMSDMITAVKAGEIDASCFRLEEEKMEHAPDNPDQVGHGSRSGWMRCKLFVDPDATIAQLQIYMVKMRGHITLQRKDLRDQLSKSPGWIEGKHTKRFGSEHDKTPIKCWGFNLDTHPMGYQPVDMETYDQWLEHPDEGDPRLGPLYTIVDWLRKYKEKKSGD